MSFIDWLWIVFGSLYLGYFCWERIIPAIRIRIEYRRKLREAESIRDACHAASGCSLYFFQDADDQAMVICETHGLVRALMTESDAFYWRTVFVQRVAEGKGRYL